MGLGAILDQDKAFPGCQIPQGLDIRGDPVKVHDQDGGRPGADRRCRSRRIHRAPIALDIHINGAGPCQKNGLRRCRGRQGRNEHLVTGADTAGLQGQLEGIGSRGYADRMPRGAGLGEGGFKGRDLCAKDRAFAGKDAGQGCLYLCAVPPEAPHGRREGKGGVHADTPRAFAATRSGMGTGKYCVSA